MSRIRRAWACWGCPALWVEVFPGVWHWQLTGDSACEHSRLSRVAVKEPSVSVGVAG